MLDIQYRLVMKENTLTPRLVKKNTEVEIYRPS